MTIDVSALTADAVEAFGEEAVAGDGQVVRIDLGDTSLAFVARADGADALVCRAFVAGITRLDDPAAFCREALEANFFWSGTEGATLSVDADATALYLTERLSPDEIAGPEALGDYVRAFVETLSSWRLRVRSRQGGVDALPDSADFAVPEADRKPVPTEPEDMHEAIRSGMEVFR